MPTSLRKPPLFVRFLSTKTRLSISLNLRDLAAFLAALISPEIGGTAMPVIEPALRNLLVAALIAYGFFAAGIGSIVTLVLARSAS